MSQGEQDALAAQRTAKREGAVAFHYQKSRESSPLDEGDPLRAHCLEGWDAASQRRNRLDMSPATAEGYRAFQDGLHRHECRYGRTQAATAQAALKIAKMSAGTGENGLAQCAACSVGTVLARTVAAPQRIGGRPARVSSAGISTENRATQSAHSVGSSRLCDKN
jgi:hypothetical protein